MVIASRAGNLACRLFYQQPRKTSSDAVSGPEVRRVPAVEDSRAGMAQGLSREVRR